MEFQGRKRRSSELSPRGDRFVEEKPSITGASVVAHWSLRRIQPLQQRVHLGFQCTSDNDPTRYTKFKISHDDVKRRVNRLLKDVVGSPSVGGAFKAGKRSREVLDK